MYDLIFLGLFTLFVIFFIRKKKKNLGKESMLGLPVYLYRTQVGVKFIDYVSKKFGKALHVIKYAAIAVGYVLMATMIYIIGKSLYIYIAFPQITEVIKAPPIAPLIPYFPQIFGVESLFPPFYFTYFIVALAIVAVVHEFSHGIFMKLFKIKIKSTGFAFFGPFLGAFVEEEPKQMAKKSNLSQLSVLSAGVFANIIFALIFFGLLVGFFNLTFTPSGYIFNTYSYSFIPASQIAGFGNLSSNLTEVYTKTNGTYYLDSSLKSQLAKNYTILTAYDDAPAIKSGMQGAITSVNNIPIKESDDLKKFFSTTEPGENITITTIKDNKVFSYNITLAANPLNSSIGYLGIGSLKPQTTGIVGGFMSLFTSFKDSSIYYQPRANSELVIFIYDLLWWVMIINFLVGLFNMLPLGFLDGGRFFYLTVLSITKSKKISNYSFRYISYAIALIFLLMLVFWFIAII